jgi:hypothetical protein
LVELWFYSICHWQQNLLPMITLFHS